MDIHCGFSINGVAALHTDILTKSELKPFYDLYPEKFNNKTNGVTFRRWLEVCDPELAGLIDQCIGSGWRRDARELEGLTAFAGDEAVLDRLLEIKQHNKEALCRVLKDAQGMELDPQSVFDIQVKRLHEYKRQQMNALYLIHKYLEIKAGKLPKRPITAIFGAKASPACDISEQISLASKEASGTSNMKFMAYGAVTLGTLDGANVEIAELVGEGSC